MQFKESKTVKRITLIIKLVILTKLILNKVHNITNKTSTQYISYMEFINKDKYRNNLFLFLILIIPVNRPNNDINDGSHISINIKIFSFSPALVLHNIKSLLLIKMNPIISPVIVRINVTIRLVK
mgnify:CR=1 FL=1